MLAQGITTLEIKSGYGLEMDSERKMLQAARKLGTEYEVDVLTTFLAAHAVPREFAGKADEYIAEVVKMMAPLKEEGLVDFVDCFMESIGFSEQQTATLFDAAKGLGLPLRLHGDQLNDLKCGEFVAKYGALSCDHCEYTSEESCKAMGQQGTVAVLLPTANYFINESKMPPVQSFRDHKVKMAVATNCNPGSSPCVSILLALNMACSRFRMTPEEALAGVTRHAAAALGKADRGSLEVGKRADVCVWDCKDPCELAYYMGMNPLQRVFVAGKERK
jgi:imidazolonepropionase